MPPHRCVHSSPLPPLPQPGPLHCLCPGPLADPPPQHPNGTCEHPSLGMSLFCLPPSVAPISLGVDVQVLPLPPTPPHPAAPALPQAHPGSHMASCLPLSRPPTGLRLPRAFPFLPPRLVLVQRSPRPAPLFLGGSLLKPHLPERLAVTYPRHSTACLNTVPSELLLGPAAVLCFCLLTLQTAGTLGQGSLTGIE